MSSICRPRHPEHAAQLARYDREIERSTAGLPMRSVSGPDTSAGVGGLDMASPARRGVGQPRTLVYAGSVRSHRLRRHPFTLAIGRRLEGAAGWLRSRKPSIPRSWLFGGEPSIDKSLTDRVSRRETSANSPLVSGGEQPSIKSLDGRLNTRGNSRRCVCHSRRSRAGNCGRCRLGSRLLGSRLR